MKCAKCYQSINSFEEVRYGLHVQCFEQWFRADKDTPFVALQNISTASSSGTDFSSPDTSFFQGKFKKYSAQLNGENYIFKMKQDQAPELPDVEYVCNQIASICCINVASFYLIEFNGERVFVTKNFIQPEIGDDLQHIYQFRLNDPHDCETLIQVIAESTQQPIAVDIFIKTLLFDALIMNHDRHGRNLAFIARSEGYYLSPIYDNVSYLGLESGEMLKADFDMKGKIITQATSSPSMKDYAVELIRLGYKKKVQDFYDRLRGAEGIQIGHAIDYSFCSDLMKEALKRHISKRFKELENALSA